MWIDDDRYTDSVADRVQHLASIDPEFGVRLRERVLIDKDYDYFWDGFMLDQIVLGASDIGNAQEAGQFLIEAPERLRKEILYGNEDWTPEYIDSLYELGVAEVIIHWVKERIPWSQSCDYYGELVIRLPSDQPLRGKVIAKLSEQRIADGDPAGLKDYGQQFAYLW